MKSVHLDTQTHYIPEEISYLYKLHKCSEDCPCEPELVIDKDDADEDNKELWYHNKIQ